MSNPDREDAIFGGLAIAIVVIAILAGLGFTGVIIWAVVELVRWITRQKF